MGFEFETVAFLAARPAHVVSLRGLVPFLRWNEIPPLGLWIGWWEGRESARWWLVMINGRARRVNLW